MPLRLNQVIALHKGAKGPGEAALTVAYHQVQATTSLTGIMKTYQPRDEEGEKLPSEGVKLQARVEETLDLVRNPLGRLLDLTATLDAGNQLARANVEIDGVAVLRDVPVTTLLALEKKLVDLTTFVKKLPILDPAEEWEYDENVEGYRTRASSTVRTKKVPRNHVKAEATDKHPAQVDVYYEDTVVGDWTTVRFSGAISAARKRELVGKVEALSAAVKVAREEANTTEVSDVKIADAIFGFLGW